MVSLDEANRSCRMWSSSIIYLKRWVLFRNYATLIVFLQVAIEYILSIVQKNVADCSASATDIQKLDPIQDKIQPCS